MILAFSASAFTETKEEADAKEATMDEDIHATNQFIATKWDQINRSVDMFFSNQNNKKKETKSSVFVYTSLYQKEGESLKTDYDFQLRFDLPNTTKKLKIVIEKQQDEISNVLSDTSAPNSKAGSKNNKNTRKDDSHYTAGASYFLKRTQSLVSYIHFGIRIDMPLNPNLKFDVEKNFKTNYMNVGLLQKVIVYRQQGLQNISQVVLNKKWTKNLQTDFTNSLVWTDETDEFVLRHNVVLYQSLGEEKGISYSVGTNAKFSPTYYYDSYDLSVSYRQLVYMDWLYATWTAGIDFPKVSHFNDEKYVQFRVDIFFREKE